MAFGRAYATLAVQPPVAHPPSIRLLAFRDARPSREIAMFWRRSSAMGEFLTALAAMFRALPAGLLAGPVAPAPQPAGAPPPSLL